MFLGVGANCSWELVLTVGVNSSKRDLSRFAHLIHSAYTGFFTLDGHSVTIYQSYYVIANYVTGLVHHRSKGQNSKSYDPSGHNSRSHHSITNVITRKV